MTMSNDTEKKLLQLHRSLSAENRRSLMAYAEFLAGREPVAAAAPAPMPQLEQVPENESVVMAIKRLTRVYPMLDRRRLMGPTSELISQHALHGRPAAEIIAELEIVFERHYRESGGNA